MGPADAAAMEAAVAASPLAAKYTASVEVESAVDQLKAKTDAAEAARAAEDARVKEMVREQKTSGSPRRRSRTRSRRTRWSRVS